jgi:hypothetical protein
VTKWGSGLSRAVSIAADGIQVKNEWQLKSENVRFARISNIE